MRQIVDVIVENDGYLVRKPGDENDYIKVIPQGIQRIPCIPFYQSAWIRMGNDVRPAVSDLVETVSLLYGNVSKCNVMAACPADALPADMIMLKETFEVAGFKKIQQMSKTALLAALRVNDYIAISTSERLLILEWYRDGVVAEGKYYNKAAVSRKKLLSDIDSIRQRHENKIGIYIFDGCNELGGLYDLGELIDANKMVELLEVMADVYYRKRVLEDTPDTQTEQDKEEKNSEQEPVSREIVFGEEDDVSQTPESDEKETQENEEENENKEENQTKVPEEAEQDEVSEEAEQDELSEEEQITEELHEDEDAETEDENEKESEEMDDDVLPEINEKDSDEAKSNEIEIELDVKQMTEPNPKPKKGKRYDKRRKR